MDIIVKKGSELPRAESVSDGDDIFIIQAGETKIARKNLIGSGGGGGSDMLNAVVEINCSGSASIVLEAGTLISKEVFIGSPGSVKFGTSVGGGELIDDSIATDHIVYDAFGKYFMAATTLHLTGNFTAKLLVWLV